MHAVAKPRRLGFEPVERRLGAPFVARDDNDVRASASAATSPMPDVAPVATTVFPFMTHPLSAPVFGGDPFALS